MPGKRDEEPYPTVAKSGDVRNDNSRSSNKNTTTSNSRHNSNNQIDSYPGSHNGNGHLSFGISNNSSSEEEFPPTSANYNNASSIIRRHDAMTLPEESYMLPPPPGRIERKLDANRNTIMAHDSTHSQQYTTRAGPQDENKNNQQQTTSSSSEDAAARASLETMTTTTTRSTYGETQHHQQILAYDAIIHPRGTTTFDSYEGYESVESNRSSHQPPPQDQSSTPVELTPYHPPPATTQYVTMHPAVLPNPNHVIQQSIHRPNPSQYTVVVPASSKNVVVMPTSDPWLPNINLTSSSSNSQGSMSSVPWTQDYQLQQQHHQLQQQQQHQQQLQQHHQLQQHQLQQQQQQLQPQQLQQQQQQRHQLQLPPPQLQPQQLQHHHQQQQQIRLPQHQQQQQLPHPHQQQQQQQLPHQQQQQQQQQQLPHPQQHQLLFLSEMTATIDPLTTSHSMPTSTTTDRIPLVTAPAAAAVVVGHDETMILRQQIVHHQKTIQSLQERIKELEQENSQLRQLPTGKISQIPIEDMIDLMHEYGSEVSDTSIPPRKSDVKKASVIRQFRRWNPNFLEYFEHRLGKWSPKLGKEAELARREQSRRDAVKKRASSSSSSAHNNPANTTNNNAAITTTIITSQNPTVTITEPNNRSSKQNTSSLNKKNA